MQVFTRLRQGLAAALAGPVAHEAVRSVELTAASGADSAAAWHRMGQIAQSPELLLDEFAGIAHTSYGAREVRILERVGDAWNPIASGSAKQTVAGASPFTRLTDASAHRGKVELRDGSEVAVELVGVHPRRINGDDVDDFARHAVSAFDDARAGADLQRLAFTDELTGAPNRRSILARLTADVPGSAAPDGTPLGLIGFDIDHFKAVNDTYGHAVGDDALRVFAQALDTAAQRAGGSVGRLGGEEFAIIVPNGTPERTLAVANDALETVRSARVPVEGHEPLALTASAGVTSTVGLTERTTLRRGADLVDALLAEADTAMYGAKETGRDRIVVAGT